MPPYRAVRTPNGELRIGPTHNGKAVQMTISRGDNYMSIFLSCTKADRAATLLDDLVAAIQDGDFDQPGSDRAGNGHDADQDGYESRNRQPFNQDQQRKATESSNRVTVHRPPPRNQYPR